MSRFLAIVAGIGAIALALTLASIGAAPPFAAQSKERNKMSSTVKPVCVGRLIVNLPDNAEWQFRGAAIDSFDVTVERETDDAFERRVKARIEKLAHPVELEGSKIKPLELARPFVAGDFKGTLLVAERDTSYSIENDKKVWSTSIRIEAYARSQGFSVDLSSRFRDPTEIERPLQILEQIVLNPENLPPNEPGFCIGNAFLREPLSANLRERITLLAGLKGHPDFTLMFDSTVGAQIPTEDLLTRHSKWKESISVLDRMRVHDINQSSRTINGFPGQETLTRYRESNHTTGFSFSWESRSEPGNVLRPALYLEMQSGVNRASGGAPIDSSFSQEEMLTMWQRITSSIRLRPTTTEAYARPTPDIGARASAGAPCPRGGWWECSEDGGTLPIAGGRRRHFKEGDIFPQADVLAPQTLWEKVKGHQATFQSKYPTVWRLVQLDAKENT